MSNFLKTESHETFVEINGISRLPWNAGGCDRVVSFNIVSTDGEFIESADGFQTENAPQDVIIVTETTSYEYKTMIKKGDRARCELVIHDDFFDEEERASYTNQEFGMKKAGLFMDKNNTPGTQFYGVFLKEIYESRNID